MFVLVVPEGRNGAREPPAPAAANLPGQGGRASAAEGPEGGGRGRRQQQPPTGLDFPCVLKEPELS